MFHLDSLILTKFIIVYLTAGSEQAVNLQPTSLFSPLTQNKYDVPFHIPRLCRLIILALNEPTSRARFLATANSPRLCAPSYAISLFLVTQLSDIDYQLHWRLYNPYPRSHTRGSRPLVLRTKTMLPPRDFTTVLSLACA